MEAQFEAIESERLWQQLYIAIKTRSLQHDYSTKEAKRPEHRNLNRYRDVSPFDHSRVVLQRSEIDYINASEVPIKEAERCYILTQGPLPSTLSHFWVMIWEKNTKGIIMLNKLIEKDINKCHQYWPEKNDPEMVFEDVNLSVKFVSDSRNESYICRTFKLHDHESNETREVIQFHYTNWPDFGVPQNPYDFLDFLDSVRRSGCLESNVGPAVIHCSAGIGRSGTFCLVDSILKMIENGRILEDDIDIVDILLEMRRYRMSLIQTAEQLRFSYLAIIEALRRHHGKSPYLAQKMVEEGAPPPPPHRPKRLIKFTVVKHIEESSSEEEETNPEQVLESQISRDSAVSTEVISDVSEDEEEDDGAPPPLPPKDIPFESKSDEDLSKVSEAPTVTKYDSVSEDLDSFEKQILATENMNQSADKLANTIAVPKDQTEEQPESEISIRKRQRDKKINEQIQLIKKGMLDSEAAYKRKGLFDNLGVRFVLILGAGFIVYRIIDYVRN